MGYPSMDNTSETDNKLKETYRLIASANEKAYNDIFLLSNEVLSKNPFTNNFLKYFLKGDTPQKVTVFLAVIKLVQYYAKSAWHFAGFLFRFLEYALARTRFIPSKEEKELILIDVFFLVKKIVKSGRFTEEYFPGLEAVLKKNGKHFTYLPFFYPQKGIFSLYRTLKVLKRENVPFIAEQQLLGFADIFRVLYFIIAYPFHVLSFMNKIDSSQPGNDILRYELLDSLDRVAFFNYCRYLAGVRIAQLPYETIKVISWFENQAIDKNLYKGLRAGSGKVSIYGAQLFLYANADLNSIVDDNERKFGIIPDKIIKNGQYYMPPASHSNYAIGPSFRSAKVFTTRIEDKNRKNILILLPFLIDEVENILRIVSGTDMSSYNVIIKPHPVMPAERYRRLIPPCAMVANEDIYKLFENARIVIGAASAALVEAVSVGIPVILIENTERWYYNLLPEYGKGIAWVEADGPHELTLQIKRFDRAMAENQGAINEVADTYKKAMFCMPTDDAIVNAFDLK